MEVRDGFIVGIFNYCDSWCERASSPHDAGCSPTPAEIEASLDLNCKRSSDAPPSPRHPSTPTGWMQKRRHRRGMNEASTARSRKWTHTRDTRSGDEERTDLTRVQWRTQSGSHVAEAHRAVGLWTDRS